MRTYGCGIHHEFDCINVGSFGDYNTIGASVFCKKCGFSIFQYIRDLEHEVMLLNAEQFLNEYKKDIK